MNNREDPDPVRKGTGSLVVYTKYVYRENRNSLLIVSVRRPALLRCCFLVMTKNDVIFVR